MKGWIILLIAILLIAALGMFFTASSQSVTGNAAAGNLPNYALALPIIKEAYTFALDNPEALDGVNCHCGCMQHVHDGRLHKRGLLDCFKKEDGSFEKHASECDMCIRDALQVKQMTENEIDKEKIKQAIDAKYAKLDVQHG